MYLFKVKQKEEVKCYYCSIIFYQRNNQIKYYFHCRNQQIRQDPVALFQTQEIEQYHRGQFISKQKIKIFNQKECCDICAVGFDRYLKQDEKGYIPITCYGCNLSCHLYCYGRNTPIILENNQLAYFVCDKCNIDPKKDFECNICKNKGGLKRILKFTDNELVHPICALMAKDIEIEDAIEFSLIRTINDKKPPTSLIHCDICKQTGAQSCCEQGGCKKHVHYNCVLKQYKSMKILSLAYQASEAFENEADLRKTIWEYKINCESIKNLNQVQIGKGGVSSLNEDIKQLALDMMKQYHDIENGMMDDPNKKSKKKVKGLKHQVKEEDQWSGIQSNVEKLFDQYNNMIETNFTQEEEQHDKNNMISLCCPEHRDEGPIYCLCRSSEQNDDMVQCECCLEWYHYHCVGVEPNSQLEDKYVCQSCDDWNKFRFDQILQSQHFNEIEDFTVAAPKQYLLLQFVDLILYLFMAQRFLELFESQRFNENQFIQVQKLVATLPFQNSLSTKIKKWKQKSYFSDFMTYVFGNINYRNDSVYVAQTQFDSSQNLKQIQSAVTCNQTIRQNLEKVVHLFQDMDEVKIYRVKLQQFNLLIQIKDLIITHNKKVFKDEFKKILVDVQQLDQGLVEVQFIKSQKEKYSAIKETFKELFRDKITQQAQLNVQLQAMINNIENSYNYINILDEVENVIAKCQAIGVPIKLQNSSDYYVLLYDIYIKSNSRKPTIEQFDVLINEGKTIIFDIAWLRQLQVDCQDWQKDFNDDLTLNMVFESKILLKANLNQIEDYVESIIKLPILLDNQEHIIKAFCNIKSFLYHIGLFKQLYRRVGESDSDSNNSDSQNSQSNESFNPQISVEIIDEMFLIGVQIQANHQDLIFLGQLQERVKKIKQEVNSYLNKEGFNEQMKKKVQRELLNQNKFIIPEMSLLQDKIKNLQDVQDLMNKKISLEQCQKASSTIMKFQFDDKLLQYFNSEINKVENIRGQIAQLLVDREINDDKLLTAKKIIQQIQNCKIDLSKEKTELLNLQLSIDFLEEIYQFYQKYKSSDHEMEIEFEKTTNMQSKLRSVDNPEKIMYDQGKDYLQELNKIVQKYEGISHLDEKIEARFKQYLTYVWRRQVEKLFEKLDSHQEIDYTQVESIFSKAERVNHVDSCIMTKLSTFKQQYDDKYKIVQSLIDQSVLQSIHVNSTQEELNQWLITHSSVKMYINGGIWDELQVCRLWVMFNQRCLAVLNSKKQLNYNALVALKEVAKSLGVPLFSNHLTQINITLDRFKKLHQELRKYSYDRESFYEYQTQTAQQKVDRPFKRKANLQTAQQLLESCQNSTVFIDSTQLQQDLNKMKDLHQQFTELDVSQPIEHIDLQHSTVQFQEIQLSLSRQFINDTDLSSNIRLQLIKIKYHLVLSGTRKIEVDKAKELNAKAIAILSSLNIHTIPPWLIKLQELIEEVQNIQSQCKEITKIQDEIDASYKSEKPQRVEKLSLEYIKKVLSKAKRVKAITISDQIENLQQIVSESERVIKGYAEFMQVKGKHKEIDFLRLYDQSKRLPVQLQEQVQLAASIDAYKEQKILFQNMRSQIADNKNNPNGKQLEKLVQDFDKSYQELCHIQIPDADAFLKEYNDFQNKLLKIEQKLADIGNKFDLIPSIVQEFSDLKYVFRWGEKYDTIKLKLWTKNVQKLKNSQTYSCNQLKVILDQGYEIIDQVLLYNKSQERLINKMKEDILELEDLMYKVGIYLLFPDRDDERHLVENKIEVYEQVLEFKSLTQDERQAIVNERFKIKKPFDNLQEYLRHLQEQKTKKQNQQARQQQAQKQQKQKLNLNQRGSTKRKVVPASKENNFVYETIKPNRDQESSDEGRPQKKIKTDANVKSHPVTQIIREQKRTQLLELLKKNPTFMNRGEKQLETKVKEIENQEFGDHHQNKNRYIEKFDKLLELLMNLQDCSHLSERLYKKNFSQNNVELMLNWVKDDKIKEKETQLREVQIKKRETDLKQKPQTPYDPLNIKPIQPVIQQRKIPPAPLQALNKIDPLPILEVRRQKVTKPFSADDELIIPQFSNQNKKNKPIQQQEKPQQDYLSYILEGTREPILRAQKHRASPSPKRRQSSNSRSSSSSHQKRRKPKSKKVKHQSKKADDYRPSRSSQSSDLPDFAQKGAVKSIIKSVAILYDPDREEQNVPILVPKQTISIIFGTQVHKIGRSKLIRDKDSSLRLEFYTQEFQHKFKEIPQIANELKMKQYQVKSLMTYIDTKIDQPQFRMIVGWVYPEQFKDLGEVNRLAESYKKDKHVGIFYHNNTTNFILAHIDQIQDSKLFSAFKPYDNFVPKNKFRKDDGIMKYWGKLQSNLIFILYVKDAAASQLSDFKPINVETIEMMENMDEVKRWVDKRRDEIRKEDSKKKTEKNHFTNNNISKEKVEKMQSVSPSNHREISEPKSVQQPELSQVSQHEEEMDLEPVTSEEDDDVQYGGMDALMRQHLNIESQLTTNAQPYNQEQSYQEQQYQEQYLGTANAQNRFPQQPQNQFGLPQNYQYQQRYPNQQYQNPAEKK